MPSSIKYAISKMQPVLLPAVGIRLALFPCCSFLSKILSVMKVICCLHMQEGLHHSRHVPLQQLKDHAEINGHRSWISLLECTGLPAVSQALSSGYYYRVPLSSGICKTKTKQQKMKDFFIPSVLHHASILCILMF